MLPLSAQFAVVDSHTAGHPTRVIFSGIPPLKGDSVLEQREDFKARFDNLRGTLLHEPRGHAAMVGALLVPSRVADYGAIFISSYVYLDMCGHATIGLARTLAANGQLQAGRDDSFTLEAPAGVVTVHIRWNADGSFAGARLINVPNRPLGRPVVVQHEDFGAVTAELIYGGMWYALIDAVPLGLPLSIEHANHVQQVGYQLKSLIAAATADLPEMAGHAAASVMFYREEPVDGYAVGATQMLVLDKNKFDRSPCGTGTSARLAQLVHQGRIGKGDAYLATNLLGTPFVARPVEVDEETGYVTAAVEGTAHITAFSTIVVEANDPLIRGFLPR